MSIDLEAIEARANAATAGPWSYNLYSAIFAMGCWTEFDKWEDEQFKLGHTLESHRKCDLDCGEHGCLLALEHYTRDPIVCSVPSFMGDTALGNRPADAVFIADARTDVPDLIAEVRRLRGLLDDTHYVCLARTIGGFWCGPTTETSNEEEA